MQAARGSQGALAIIPTTVAAASRPSSQARLLLDAASSAIVEVNPAFTELCGYSMADAQGATLRSLTSALTHGEALDAFMLDCAAHTPSSMENYVRRRGERRVKL